MEVSRPAVTVVVATDGCQATTSECIDSLKRQTLQRTVEILIADSAPELLGDAVLAAQGEIVMITDSRCRFPADWAETLVQAHASEFQVIGGAVEHDGPDTLAGWACYFADYGAFAQRAPRRITPILAGNHVSYKRALVHQSRDLLLEGYRKTFFHLALEREQVSFLFNPELVVRCRQSQAAWQFTRRYYRNAYQFAGVRCREFSFGRRVFHAATAVALPVLLLYRRLTAAWVNGHRMRLVLATPLLAVFVTAWSLGELRGYLREKSAA